MSQRDNIAPLTSFLAIVKFSMKRLIWDSHTGETAVPGGSLDGGTRKRKGDAYANSVVIMGFFSKIPTKVAASGLAEVATIPSPSDGPCGRSAAHR
jgi:hypothetical protein